MIPLAFCSIFFLLVALTSCVAYKLPPFSWNTLPVAWHGSSLTTFSPDEVSTLARYPVITIEKFQGGRNLPWKGNVTAAEVCQNGSDAAACGCCEEDNIVNAFSSIKKINPNVSTIAYINGIIAYPWYRTAQFFLKHPDYLLRDINGHPLNNIRENPIETWYTWDFSIDEVGSLFEEQCLSMVKTGVVDGCFVDGCPNVPGPLNTTVRNAYTNKKHAMLANLQQKIPGLLVCGSGGTFLPGMGATQVQNWGLLGNYSKREIPMLQHAMNAGVVFLAHGANVCKAAGNPLDPDLQTELAAFLIAAGPHAYYMCGGWKGTKPIWYEVYDKAIGKPLSNATITDGVYKRVFKSGTVVTYNTHTETGKIMWSN